MPAEKPTKKARYFRQKVFLAYIKILYKYITKEIMLTQDAVPELNFNFTRSYFS